MIQVTWKFKLNPSSTQAETMAGWQRAVGRFYNICLADRMRTYQQTHMEGPYCDLRHKLEIYKKLSDDDFGSHPITCCVNRFASLGYPWKSLDPKKGRGKDTLKPQSPKRSPFEMQSFFISDWRDSREEYKDIPCDVLQQALRHVDKAFKHFFTQGCGFPRFKKHYEVGFEFKPGTVFIKGNRIMFPGLKTMPLLNSRNIPSIWDVRTITIRPNADGWYVSILFRQDTVLDIPLKNDRDTMAVLGINFGNRKIVSRPRWQRRIVQSPVSSETRTPLWQRHILDGLPSAKKISSR